MSFTLGQLLHGLKELHESLKPKTGWSQSSNITSGLGANRYQLSLQCKLDEPDVYTVQFHLQNVDITKGRHTVAVVEWTVEGNAVRRIISVNNGTSISGVGKYVKIYVFDDAPIVFGAVQTYVCSILVSKGVRANIQQPVTYSPVTVSPNGDQFPGAFLLAAGTEAGISIPTDAGIVSVFTTAGATTDPPTILTEAQIQVQQNAASPIRLYDPRIPAWVPLVDTAVQLFFINKSGVEVKFGFTYGIDG